MNWTTDLSELRGYSIQYVGCIWFHKSEFTNNNGLKIFFLFAFWIVQSEWGPVQVRQESQ